MLIDSKVQTAAIYKKAKLEKEVTSSTFVILLPSTTLIGFLAERKTTQGFDLWKDVLYSAKVPDIKLDLETL